MVLSRRIICHGTVPNEDAEGWFKGRGAAARTGRDSRKVTARGWGAVGDDGGVGGLAVLVV